jgi:hypothetical protein
MPSVAAPIEERAGKRNGSLAVKPFCHEKSILLQWSNGRKAVSVIDSVQHVLGRGARCLPSCSQLISPSSAVSLVD